tara:strand:- start:13624 stop:15084 length:1461 start_codon:yes stop_codon:yes gene_type:complete
MSLNLSNYSSVYYRSQIESKRAELIKELIYSDDEQRLDVLKRLHPEESNLEIKFEIRRAIDDLESLEAERVNSQIDYDEKLRQTLRYAETSLRHQTLKAIVSNRRSDLLEMMREVSAQVKDPYIEAAILKLLALNPVKNLKEICSYLKSSDDRVVASTIQIIGSINNTQSLALVANYLTHPNNRVRSNAAIAFEKSEPDLTRKVIEKMAYSEYVAYRSSAAYALSVTSFKGSTDILDFLLTDSDPGVRAKAHKARATIDEGKASRDKHVLENEKSTKISHATEANDLNALENISQLLVKTSDPKELSTIVLRCSQVIADDEQKIALIKPFLRHENGRVRANALESLTILYPETERDFFLDFLVDTNNRVIGNAIFILSAEDHCPEQYREKICAAIENLMNNHQINGCLTALYCIGNCRDEIFLPYLIQLASSEEKIVADKAHSLLSAWAETSGAAKNALRDMIKRNLSIQFSGISTTDNELKDLLE